jgi:hypothetical protein
LTVSICLDDLDKYLDDLDKYLDDLDKYLDKYLDEDKS